MEANVPLISSPIQTLDFSQFLFIKKKKDSSAGEAIIKVFMSFVHVHGFLLNAALVTTTLSPRSLCRDRTTALKTHARLRQSEHTSTRSTRLLDIPSEIKVRLIY